MSSPPASTRSLVTPADLDAPPRTCAVQEDGVSDDDVLIDGVFSWRCLRPGLALHVSDVIERHAFRTTSVVKPGLSCIFFLSGQVELGLGARRFHVGGAGTEAPQALAVYRAEEDEFRRATLHSQRVRKAVITISDEWMDLEGVGPWRDAGQRAPDHLSSRSWRMGAALRALIEQAVTPPALADPLQSLYLESRAIDIVSQTLIAITDDGGQPGRAGPADARKLNRAVEFIHANLDQPLSVEVIARHAGASASLLQRLFRAGHHCGVSEFVRRLRLERARNALARGDASIAEAAALAGYTSPANFATAFRRCFGEPPGAVRGDV